jgi:hypothetical protein
MAKGKGLAYGAFGLEFLGGIFFLITAALLLNGGSTGYSSALSAWNTGVASLWLPFIYPVAIFAAIAVFLISFANLAGWGRRAAGAAMKTTWAAAIALFLMTAGTSWMWLVVIGFVLSIIGSAASMGEKM